MEKEKRPPIKIYGYLLSQPVRAVIMLCKFNNIPFEHINVRAAQGETHKADFRKMFPLRQVPTIDDDGFKLGESHAILRYLCGSRKLDDKWYPSDPKKRALVDQYLDWHHLNTRKAHYYLIQANAQLFPKDAVRWDPETMKEDMLAALQKINDIFLKDHKFIASDDEMTIADLIAVSEIANLVMGAVDLSKYPRLYEWFNRLMSNDTIKEVHETLFKFNAKIPRSPKL